MSRLTQIKRRKIYSIFYSNPNSYFTAKFFGVNNGTDIRHVAKFLSSMFQHGILTRVDKAHAYQYKLESQYWTPDTIAQEMEGVW